MKSTRGTLVVVLAATVSTAAFLLLFYLPRGRAMTAMQTELNDKLSYILDAQRASKLCQQLEAELAASREYNEQSAEQLVHRANLPALYGEVSQIAKARKIATPKFEPRPEVDYDTFHKVSVTLGVQGTYNEVCGLIYDLEAMPVQVWVTDISLRAPRDNGKLVDCDMTLVVFVDHPKNNN